MGLYLQNAHGATYLTIFPSLFHEFSEASNNSERGKLTVPWGNHDMCAKVRKVFGRLRVHENGEFE